MNNIISQLYSLFIFIFTGIIIGLLFDFFRILRKSFKTIDLITYLEDIIFWILTGICILFVLFTFQNGEIRSYNVIGLLLGFSTYMFTISKYIIKVNVQILVFLKNILYKFFYIIFYPIKMIIKFIISTIKPLIFTKKPKNVEKI